MSNNQSFEQLLKRRTAGYAAAGAAALALLAGGAWQMATDAQASGPAPATVESAAAPASAPDPRAIAGARASYADVVKVVAPAVVTIQVEGQTSASPTIFQGDEFFRRFFGDDFPNQMQPRRMRGMGSGVIVSADGYILTNNHVVDRADKIRVETTDGRTFDAKVVGVDPPTDLALLKVDATSLHTLTLGNSDAVNVGDVVLAVGNPLGIGQTVTMGIISAKGRSTSVGDGSYEDFLQTDAPINHGNSGGALVNLDGELIGINSQIMSENGGNIGIGFAIPANMARNVMDQLRTTGKVTRAQLGVTIQRVTPEMAESLGLKEAAGAIVSSVSSGSAAERAGIKQGDVIKSFNGQPVNDTNALRNRVAAAKPGSNASVEIVRDGEEKTLTVTLDEARPQMNARNRGFGPAEDDKAALGVAVAPLTPELADRLGLDDDATGLVIQQVDPDGRAAEAGLRSGDVIQQVNRTPVTSVEELRDTVRSADNDKPLLLLVARDGRSIFVTVRPANG